MPDLPATLRAGAGGTRRRQGRTAQLPCLGQGDRAAVNEFHQAGRRGRFRHLLRLVEVMPSCWATVITMRLCSNLPPVRV